MTPATSPRPRLRAARRVRRAMVLGLCAPLLAAVGLAAPQAAATPADTTTIGTPGHITLTAPKSVEPGGYALLELAYTNTTDRLIDRAPLTITFGPEADASVNLDGVSYVDGGQGHTQTVTGDPATRTVTVDWRYFNETDSATAQVHVPFKDTAAGPVPLRATLMENLSDGPVTTDLGSLVVNDAPAAADLGVTLDASPRGLGVTHASFTATVTNHGPATATGARLRFTYPVGFTLPNAPGCTVNAAARTATCDLPALADGASTTRTLGLHAQLLTISNHLDVTAGLLPGTPADPRPADDSATHTCAALTTLLVTC
ncbi:hypothetical protein ACN20G_28780 (plasmid) [Streptomyces sp. BI20]|uniref:hypothetical protein n=1 Tax=Streptomyces sp. BI20 TaxID=3403460 RepID=UPI003C719D21